MSEYASDGTVLTQGCDYCGVETAELFVCVECGMEVCGKHGEDTPDGVLCPLCAEQIVLE